MFLQLCYLDRVVVQSVQQPKRRTLPIISRWDDVSVNQRNIIESRGECFGCGKVREEDRSVEEADADLEEERIDSLSPSNIEKVLQQS